MASVPYRVSHNIRYALCGLAAVLSPGLVNPSIKNDPKAHHQTTYDCDDDAPNRIKRDGGKP